MKPRTVCACQSVAFMISANVQPPLRPSIGAQVSRACALANARGPEVGLRALEAIPPDDVASYQPFWAARAHLLAAGGARAAARQAYDRAIGLSANAAVRAYLNAMSQRL